MTSQEPGLEKYKILTPEKPPFEDAIDYLNFRDRVLFFHGDVDEYPTTWASKILSAMCMPVEGDAAWHTKPISVILDSFGGAVYDGLLLFDTIRSITRRGIPVNVEVRGMAASMAAVILQAGTKRIASKHARFMIHEVSDLLFGKATEVEEQAVETRKVNDLLRDIIAERTGKASADIDAIWKKRDVYMSSQEALAFGLVDEVV